MEQFIGKVLHDRYRIQSILGGQTGRRTFLANDLQTGLLVVVKLLLFSPDFTWEHLKLFERETEVLKFLEHPAIPQYLDYFDVEIELGKGFALVQTYIEAKSLSDWIQSGRTFSEDDIKAIAKELLKILDYLHSRQPPVIHRDIKPSNILLADRSGNSIGQVYLIDLGSVQTAVHGGTRTIVGTYGYMPLEQFGGETTPASDLYALGGTLIYLATGQHPDRLPQKQMRIQFEERVNLSPHLIDWLKSMTEPSLDLRLKSVKQALEALENQLTVITKPYGSKVQVTKTIEMLEIFVPPRGFHLGLIFLILLKIPMCIPIFVGYRQALANWLNPDGWFMAFFLFLLLGANLGMIWIIIFTLFGTFKLCITQSKISRFLEIFGLRYRGTLTASRQNITKIELTSVSYEIDSEGDTFEVPPEINIWAGTKKFTLNNDIGLTPPELDWLAQELSCWLNLPITRNEFLMKNLDSPKS
ncbi:MAG: serine/threonine protein kinase [Okeania sp. SIO3I5]|uniref:serine/threonine protein kinase n=1 Tax=Okeania sp. SIO3I5 TaxID=2607805 RepID=UPI0013B6DD07|nr:serine/threonine-protein kinase [Okeania sp. SIO3I5]NEQ40960.1 serine/threonine protein kinase [Okeania sp. SIO3I5]